jgi:hypothetical protein
MIPRICVHILDQCRPISWSSRCDRHILFYWCQLLAQDGAAIGQEQVSEEGQHNPELTSNLRCGGS